jgi:hypothetical protein
MTKETNQFKMGIANTKTKSLLAQALTDAIVGAGLYSREDWAFILDVSEPAISQWLSDTTLPRPEMLRMIINTLRESAGVSPEILARFDALRHMPATEISPHGARMGGSLAHYLARPLREGILRELDVLSPDSQEQVLAVVRRLCRDAARRKAMVKAEPESVTAPPIGVPAHEVAETTEQAPFTRADLMALTVEETVDLNPTAWVVTGARQSALIGTPPRLRVVGQEEPSFNIISGMFSASNEQQKALGEDELLTCAILIWVFPRAATPFPAFLVEEAEIILYSGRIQLTFAGRRDPIILGNGPGDSNLMWLTAGRRNDLGLPKFECVPLSDEPAVGIAILYDSKGVRLNPAAGQLSGGSNPYLVRPEAREDWDAAAAERYWKDLAAEQPDLAGRLPMLARVPSGRKDLHNMIKENPLTEKERGDSHRDARCAEQVDDGNVSGWMVPKSSALRTRLIRFPECPGVGEDEIYAASHPGQEILIPLAGAFNCVYANLLPCDVEQSMFTIGDFPPEQRRHKHVESTAVSRQVFPDLFFVNSESAHGFYGANGDAYCLHVRCLPDLTRLSPRYRGVGAHNARPSRKRGVA